MVAQFKEMCKTATYTC